MRLTLLLLALATASAALAAGVDRDGDGIPDAEDRCPGEPETFNGTEDEDGCPDHARVPVRWCDLTVPNTLYFRPGSTELPSYAAGVLDGIAASMAAKPTIRLVEVRGFAQKKEPKHLGLRRAESARAALVQRGVEPERLVARELPPPKKPAAYQRAVDFAVVDPR